MKKTKLFKSLLVAAGLCVGASAWAGDEWSIDLAAIGNSLTDKTNMTISDEVVKIGGTSMGTCTAGDNALNGNFVLQTGTTWMFRTGSQGLYQFNSGGRALGMLNCTEGQIITITATGDPNPTTNVTLKSSSNSTYVYTVTADGNVKFTPARYLFFTSISVANPSATDVDYTVKYVDGNNNEIKTAATYSGNPGTSITLGDNDKAPIYKDNKKYIYSSDDSEGKTISSDGTTVVTVTFREAATYSWTAKSSVGDYTINGVTFEGDKASVKYPLYVLVDGKLWTKATSGSSTYAVSFDVTENNQEFTIDYTETDIENVVFLTEMEDVEGISIVDGGNASARSSKRAAGYSASGNTKFATLSAGKYQIFARFYSPTSAGGSFKFYTGNREIWAPTTGNANATDADTEIMLAQESNDLFLGQTGATSAVDFVYIVKTADLTEEELAEVQAADIKADKAARVFSIVGQNVTGGWDNDYAMTQSTNDGEEDIYTLTLNDFEAWPGTTYEYKLRDNNDWEGFVLPNGDANASFTVDKAGVYKLIFTADVEHYTLNVEKILTKSYTYTASFTNTYNWGAVYAYAWSGDGDTKVEQLGGWPGTQIYADANGIYTVTIMNKVEPEFIIFNANDGNQTGNLEFVDGAIYNYDGDKSVSINVTAAGYATYCSELALDFSNIEGLKAYRATINEGVVSFTEVEQVPAGEGILVKAAAGKYTVPSIASADAIDNVFVGVTEPKTISAGNFVLMSGTQGVGFYKTTKEFTVGANTAYIPALADGARTFIGFDFGGATAIEGVATVKADNGEIFNLQGQRVVKAQKGLYIINGKKMVVK